VLEIFSRSSRQLAEPVVAALTTAGGLLLPLLRREMQDAEQRRYRV
jgi:hypothetical protein